MSDELEYKIGPWRLDLPLVGLCPCGQEVRLEPGRNTVECPQCGAFHHRNGSYSAWKVDR